MANRMAKNPNAIHRFNLKSIVETLKRLVRVTMLGVMPCEFHFMVFDKRYTDCRT